MSGASRAGPGVRRRPGACPTWDLLAPTFLADERHEAAGCDRPGKNLSVLFLHEIQFLFQAVAHGDDQPAGIAQLIEQRGWYLGRARRHRDRIEGSLRRIAERAVAAYHHDVLTAAGAIETGARQRRQLRNALDRNHA